MALTLVTGGAKGLGRAIVRELAEAGHRVLVHYRESGREAEALMAELQGKAETLQGDLTSLESAAPFLAELSKRKITGVVNNVGNYLEGPASTTPPAQFLTLYQTNALIPLAIIQATLSTLQNVVNIGMVGCGTLAANRECTAYMLSKNNLYMLTRSLAQELARQGVRVNMVSPGYLETSQTQPSKAPLISLEEVARAVRFLMAPENRHITGQNIEVSGGIKL